MCNPRRVRVRASSRLTRMWQEELTRTGRATAEVMGEACLRQEFGNLLGEPARRAFEAALGADVRWTWRDDAYWLELDGGRVAYYPDTGEIEMTAQLTDVVTAEGTASRTIEGTVNAEATAERTGRYYDDSWAGLSKSVAERTARQEAETAAEQEAAQQAARQEEQERLAAQRQLDANRAALDAEAARDAERRLADPTQRRRDELSRDAAQRLADARTDFLRPVHEVLAAAYRDAIVEYARANGAEHLTVADEDGVLSVQFEMEA
ncbi:hypothetical protein ABZ746_15430 [Streptomyces sp. NPDC020096]